MALLIRIYRMALTKAVHIVPKYTSPDNECHFLYVCNIFLIDVLFVKHIIFEFQSASEQQLYYGARHMEPFY